MGRDAVKQLAELAGEVCASQIVDVKRFCLYEYQNCIRFSFPVGALCVNVNIGHGHEPELRRAGEY